MLIDIFIRVLGSKFIANVADKRQYAKKNNILNSRASNSFSIFSRKQATHASFASLKDEHSIQKKDITAFKTPASSWFKRRIVQELHSAILVGECKMRRFNRA